MHIIQDYNSNPNFRYALRMSSVFFILINLMYIGVWTSVFSAKPIVFCVMEGMTLFCAIWIFNDYLKDAEVGK